MRYLIAYALTLLAAVGLFMGLGMFVDGPSTVAGVAKMIVFVVFGISCLVALGLTIRGAEILIAYVLFLFGLVAVCVSIGFLADAQTRFDLIPCAATFVVGVLALCALPTGRILQRFALQHGWHLPN